MIFFPGIQQKSFKRDTIFIKSEPFLNRAVYKGCGQPEPKYAFLQKNISPIALLRLPLKSVTELCFTAGQDALTNALHYIQPEGGITRTSLFRERVHGIREILVPEEMPHPSETHGTEE